MIAFTQSIDSHDSYSFSECGNWDEIESNFEKKLSALSEYGTLYTEFHSQRNSLFKLQYQFSVSVDSFVIRHRRSQAISRDAL